MRRGELQAERLDAEVDRLAPAPHRLRRPARLARGELGAVVAAAAVDQVVDLVDHQDDVGEVLVRREGGERDVGIEDVVVVADRDLDAVRQLQADLEGADLGLVGGGEDVVRLDGGEGAVRWLMTPVEASFRP